MQFYDSAEEIALFRMKALRGALKLEILGMKRRGRSVYSIVKEEFGFKGGKGIATTAGVVYVLGTTIPPLVT